MKGSAGMANRHAMIAEMHLKLAYLWYRTHRQVSKHRPQTPSLVLTGAARTGKSLLASRFCANHPYVRFRFDSVGGYVRDYHDHDTRTRRTRAILSSLLARFRRGVCVEGSSALRFENYNAAGDGTDKTKFFVALARDTSLSEQEKLARLEERTSQIDLRFCTRLAKRYGVRVVLIGSLEEPEEKLQGMQKHRAAGKCWTSRYCSEEELYYLAWENHLCSRRLYDLSRQYGLPFINIASADFEGSLQRGEEMLCQLVNSASCLSEKGL